MNDKQRSYVAKSETAAHFLQALLNDVLDFSKIEANMLVMDLQSFRISGLFQELEDVLKPQAAEKGIELIVRKPEVQAQLLGDENRLRQILLNLGSNAIKFTSEGKVEIAAEVLSTRGQNLELQFSVHDTGIGIEHTHRESIFEVFTQAEANTTRRFGRSGLGLSICSGLLKLMGSSIHLESEPGVGSTFSFKLVLPMISENATRPPVDQTMEQPAPVLVPPLDTHRAKPLKKLPPSATLKGQAATQQQFFNSAKPLEGMRILVVEDSVPNQEVAQGLLEEQGAEVEIASNGQLGLEAILVASPPYDVVLMDIQMPVMDGFVATMAIRAITQFRDLPIIAMTANAIASDKDRCASIGMNGYIAKPYDIKDVVDILLEATRESKATAPQPGGTTLDASGLSVASVSRAAKGQLDLVRAIKRMGGNINVYTSVLSSFSKELGSVCHQLSEWQHEPSSDKAARLLHSCRGTSGMVGFEDLALAFADSETSLSQSQMPTLSIPDIEALRIAIEPARQTAIDLIALLKQDLSAKAKSPSQAPGQPMDHEQFTQELRQFMRLLDLKDEAAVDAFRRLQEDHPTRFMGVLGLVQKALESRDFVAAQEICDDLLIAMEL